MSADFESELAALYGRQPDLPDAAHFATDVTERIVREEKINVMFSMAAVGGVVILLAGAVTSMIASPAVASSVSAVGDLFSGVTKTADSLPALPAFSMSSPIVLAAASLIALGAVLFGQIQGRRL